MDSSIRLRCLAPSQRIVDTVEAYPAQTDSAQSLEPQSQMIIARDRGSEKEGAEGSGEDHNCPFHRATITPVSFLSSNSRDIIRRAMSDKETTVSFKCPSPECGTVFAQPLSWFTETKSMECPACNYTFTVDFEKLPEVKAYLNSLRETR